MSSSQNHVTTQEFAKKAGVSAKTVSKWLRMNKINGKKINGKWLISPSEISKVSTPMTSKSINTNSFYTIEEFSSITYLTEYGVKNWLKLGLLSGTSDDSGQARVAASNLEQPNIKRLIR